MMKIVTLIVFVLQFFLVAGQHGFVHHNGETIHYRVFGKGKSILIINGGPGMSSEGFADLARQLGENYQAIIYDQRGTGLSTIKEINSRTMTMKLMIDDIELLREHLRIKEWVVMGHSFGGMLAYFYATVYPERVKAMIQSSSGGMDLGLLSSVNITDGLNINQRDSLNYYSQQINNGDTSYATRYNRGRFLAPAYVFDQRHVPVIAQRLTQGNSRINQLLWNNLRTMNFNTTAAMKHFKKPVLIIHGGDDIVGMSIPQQAHETLPNSKLVVLDRCKHYGWLDREEAYFKAINDFLDAL